jgi:hypothetical protein
MVDVRIPGRARALAALAAVALSAFALTGCSEEPTALNTLVASLPLADMVVYDTTLVPTGATTYRQYAPMDGRVNLVGRTGGYTALSAISFYPSLFPIRDTAQVYAATLRLHCVSWFGDPNAQLSLNVYAITRGWNQSTLTWDTLQSAFYNPSVVRGTYAGSGGPDTQYVNINLDTAMVRQWLRSTTSTTDTRFGIVLEPTPSCGIVRGFSEFDMDSTQFRPTLTIIAGSATGPARDTSVYYQGIDTWAGNIDNLATNPQLLYVQAGVDYRSTMTFDVSSIPRGSIINSARLELQRDPTTSHISGFTGDTSFTLLTALSATDLTFLDGSSTVGRLKAGSANTFSVDMRRSVQLWLQIPNYGVVLKPSPYAENASLDLLTFYTQQATNALLRPQLRITYSVARK